MMASTRWCAASTVNSIAAAAAAVAPSSSCNSKSCERTGTKCAAFASASAAALAHRSRKRRDYVAPLQNFGGLRCSPPRFLTHRRGRETGAAPTSFTFGVRAISSNDFKPGVNIEFDGFPWRILEFLHVKPGKGAAFVRTKLKNYVTGSTVDKTFRAAEQVPEATVVKDVKQFSYMDGDQFVFMDMETYDEVRLSKSDVGDRTKFLTEGMECVVLSWKDKVIDMDLPVTVKLKVSEALPGVKGDTAQGGSKLVTLETGAQVSVPLFVNQDDTLVIQTKDGSYISRA